MKIDEIAADIKGGLTQHFADCRRDEFESFGVASDYTATVQVVRDGLATRASSAPVIHIEVSAYPTAEVVEAYGQTHQNPSAVGVYALTRPNPSYEPAQARFWARTFELRYDPDAEAVTFYAESIERTWVRVSAALVDDQYFSMWLMRRLSVIARHATGRDPYGFTQGHHASVMEAKADRRARARMLEVAGRAPGDASDRTATTR